MQPSRLQLVLAAGERHHHHEVATAAFFSKSGPSNTLRRAIMVSDDKTAEAKVKAVSNDLHRAMTVPDAKKAEEKVKAIVTKLKPDQIKKIADKFASDETNAWQKLKNVPKKPTNKDRHNRMEALKELLEAHLGMGTLYEFGPKTYVAALPNKPKMPEVAQFNLWPSYESYEKGTTPWPKYGMIRMFWEKARKMEAETLRGS